MNLKERIKNDLKDSMKSGDTLTRSVLRLLNSDIKNAEIAKQKELTDDDVLGIIMSSGKKRKDSIEQYKKGNRADLAENEEKELKILEKYLPSQMNEGEIRNLAQKIIMDAGAKGASDFGKVMGKIMKEAKGKADGNAVNKIVKEELDKIGK